MFEASEIQFHTAGNHLLYQETNENKHVGILKLCVNRDLSHDNTSIHVLFSVDCSSSMSDKINNRHTKLYQVVNTLKGIFRELVRESEKNNVNIYVSVVGFENTIHPILDFIKIIPENVDHLIAILDNIESHTLTNIEVALKNARDMLDEVISQSKEDAMTPTRVYHVFMTDGQITSGEENPDKLREFVNTDYPTIFIGFGKQHDSRLLTKLANFLRGEYYFIDNTENSALVYGEIVYNIIYHAIGALKLSVHNGLIYNWKDNEWTAEVDIASLSNDCEKIFHLTTYGNIHDVEIEVFSEEQLIETLYCYPPLQDIRDDATPVSVANYDPEMNMIVPVNLSKYHFRQKTQELLYETRKMLDTHDVPEQNTTENENRLEIDTNTNCHEKFREQKNRLQAFLKDMFDYMQANHLTDDAFMKRLGDDIYVLYHTLGRSDASMWCTSRQVSQGKQQTYMPSDFSEPTQHYNSMGPTCPRSPPKLSRQHTGTFVFTSYGMEDTLDVYHRGTRESPTDLGFWDNQFMNSVDNMDLSTTNPNMMNMISSISGDNRSESEV
jgi:uncharacterized protein YegL